MEEYQELQRNKGNFFGKCKEVINQAKLTYDRLKPNVETLNSKDDRDTIPIGQQMVEYLTYDHGFWPDSEFDNNHIQDIKNKKLISKNDISG